MFDQDIANSILKAAKEQGLIDTQNKPQDLNSLVIKIVQLEQFTENDIQAYLQRLCNNPMTIQTLEVIFSILRLYEFERLDKHPHLNNPQAIALIKDMENFLLQKITCILQNNKDNLVMNMSKVDKIAYFLKKKLNFNVSLCQKVKTIFRKGK